MPPVASIFLANIMNPSTDSIIIFIPSREYTHTHTQTHSLSFSSESFCLHCAKFGNRYFNLFLNDRWMFSKWERKKNDKSELIGACDSFVAKKTRCIFEKKKDIRKLICHSMLQLPPAPSLFFWVGSCLVGKIMMCVTPMEKVTWRTVQKQFSHVRCNAQLFCVILFFSLVYDDVVVRQISQATCVTFVSVTFTPHMLQRDRQLYSARRVCWVLLSCDYLPSIAGCLIMALVACQITCADARKHNVIGQRERKREKECHRVEW